MISKKLTEEILILIVQESIEMFPFQWYKSFKVKFKVPAWLPLGHRKVLNCTIEHNLGFNSTHKVHVYSFVMWYTIVLKAVKHYS